MIEAKRFDQKRSCSSDTAQMLAAMALASARSAILCGSHVMPLTQKSAPSVTWKGQTRTAAGAISEIGD
jgi:hypothetical protein